MFAANRLSDRFPPELRNTVKDIETRLEAVSRRLQALRYTQTTVAWEAPLDGTITIKGKFVTGVSKPSGPNAGPLADFTPEQFDQLHDSVGIYQAKYIDPRYSVDGTQAAGCTVWAEADYCHDMFSDPFSPHYAPSAAAQISFLRTPSAKVQVARSRRHEPKPVVCLADTDFDADGGFNLGTKTFEQQCRQNENANGSQIQVKTGDVIYLSYSVHPHFNKFLKPEVTIAYSQVDDDPAFKLIQQDPQKLLGALNCKWKEEIASSGADDCLLSRQTRYTFDLRTGMISTAPGHIIRLPAGTERTFAGRFDIPADITRDYQVYFEVLGAATPITDVAIADPSKPPAPSFKTIPAAALSQLFQQDVTNLCQTATATCTVDIKRACDGDQKDKCAQFTGDYVLTSRLVVQHKVNGPPLAVRNISARLAALKWRIAPQVTSYFTEQKAPADAVKRLTTAYLPVSMGEPDLEYIRVEQGRFANADTQLADGGRRRRRSISKISCSDEKLNVRLARIRQTEGFCGFGREIIDFLRSHYSQSGQPNADEYVDYWQAKFDDYKKRCTDNRARLDKVPPH